MKIDRDNFIPIYYQIGEKIRKEIESGHLRPGEKLPPEEELASSYQVSRNTIRGCLSKLAKEGFVKSVKGKGTFISSNAGRQKVICALTQDFKISDHIFIQAILSSIMESVHKSNALVQVNSVDQIPDLLEAVKGGRQVIDGFIAIRCLSDRPELLDLIDKAGIPLIIEGDSRRNSHSWVEIDNVKGMEKIVTHLLELGHRRFMLCDSPLSNSTHYAIRLEATMRFIRENVPEKSAISRFSFSNSYIETVYRETKQILDQDNLPTAFICMNDSIALGLERGALDLGFDIPADFSITGFDNWIPCEIVRPAMTTVCQNYFHLGKTTTETLFEMINDYNHRKKHVIVEPELIVRESTAKPRKDRKR